MVSASEKATIFRAAHASTGPGLLLGNVSTPGLAAAVQALGFQAVGTSSAGLAEDMGLKDGEPGLDALLTNASAIAAAVDVPVSADLENGRAKGLQSLGEVYRSAASAGLAGASIEDSVAPDGALLSRDCAAQRVAAALAGARAANRDFVLTARTEVFFSPHPSLDEAIVRLLTYEAAGADVLFAPGLPLESLEHVLSVVTRPLNVLMKPSDAARFPDLFSRGVRRISLGASLSRASLVAAAQQAAAALEVAR